MRREGAEDDNSDSNQHCRDRRTVILRWMFFINRSLQALWKTVNDKDKNRYRHM